MRRVPARIAIGGYALLVCACAPASSGDEGDAGARFADAAQAEWVPQTDVVWSAPRHIEPDDAGTRCTCESTSECRIPECVDGACVERARADTTPCGDAPGLHCVRGECRVRGCGDGYREPGPTPAREGCDDGNGADGDACSPACEPTTLTVASAPDGWATLAGPVPAIGVDGAGAALVVWLEESTAGLDLRAARFDYGGAPIGSPWTLAGALPLGAPVAPAVAGMDAGWVVTWASPDGPRALYRVVLEDGTTGGLREAAGEGAWAPRAAKLGDGFLLAWLSTTSDASSLIVRAFDSSGAPLTEASTIRRGALDAPALASDGTRWLVAWSETLEGRAEVLAHVYDRAKLVQRLEVSEGQGVRPSVAALVDGFAVAWTSTDADTLGDVRARRVSTSGALGGAIEVSARPRYAEGWPSVAALGTGWIVGWHERGTAGGAGALVIDSAIPDELTPLLSQIAPPGDQGGLTLAAGWDGRAWLAWSAGAPSGAEGALRSVLASIVAEGER